MNVRFFCQGMFHSLFVGFLQNGYCSVSHLLVPQSLSRSTELTTVSHLYLLQGALHIVARAVFLQPLDRHVMARSSPYCGSLTSFRDDVFRITSNEVSPLLLFPVPVLLSHTCLLAVQNGVLLMLSCHLSIISSSPLSFSIHPHPIDFKLKFSEILPGSYSLHNSFLSTHCPGVPVLIPASHYVQLHAFL